MHRKNNMSAAAAILGALAILFLSIPLIAVPLGSLAVLCALLSRTGKKMPVRSTVGLISGLIGAIGSCVITIYAFRTVMNDPTLRYYYSRALATALEEYGLPQDYNIFANPDHLPGILGFLKDAETETESGNTTDSDNPESEHGSETDPDASGSDHSSETDPGSSEFRHGTDGKSDHSRHDRSDTDDYFNNMYDDYFRYFYGVDPNLDSPDSQTETEQNPSPEPIIVDPDEGGTFI